MECPRCRSPFVDGQIRGRGGAYRGSYVRVLRCDRCKLSALDVSAIANRHGSSHVRLSATLLCRDRKPADMHCASCMRGLDLVTLSWGATYIELEECAGCGLVYLDPGELERMGGLLRVAERAPEKLAWDTEDETMGQTLDWLDELFGEL